MPKGPIRLERNELAGFFIHHLNKIYAAKTHLLEKLPAILYEAHFADLEAGIFETIKVVTAQRERMKTVYKLLNAPIDEASFSGLSGIIDDSFADITRNSNNAELRDMSILFYLANIEGMEMASFQVLQLLAVKLNNIAIQELIEENFKSAQADKTLFLLITTKYLNSLQ